MNIKIASTVRGTLGLAVIAVAMVGCSNQPAAEESAVTGHDESAHQHPTEGPHHGALIELGEEEYHAELVHDEQAGEVAVYLLDSAAKERVSIDATQLKINLTHEGKPEQFTLTASPEPSDAAGMSGRFVSRDAEFLEELDHAHSEGQLVVSINGKQYRGQLTHGGHDH